MEGINKRRNPYINILALSFGISFYIAGLLLYSNLKSRSEVCCDPSPDLIPCYKLPVAIIKQVECREIEFRIFRKPIPCLYIQEEVCRHHRVCSNPRCKGRWGKPVLRLGTAGPVGLSNVIDPCSSIHTSLWVVPELCICLAERGVTYPGSSLVVPYKLV